MLFELLHPGHVDVCAPDILALCQSDWWQGGNQSPALGTGKYVLKCLLSPDVRQLATASADKTVKLWSLDGFTLDRTLTGTDPHLLAEELLSCASEAQALYSHTSTYYHTC